MSRLRSILLRLAALLALAAAPLLGPTRAATGPKVVTIGPLYPSSGSFAAISMPAYHGAKLWVGRTDAAGGANVKAFHKKIPLKLISCDGQGGTAAVATLTDRPITQDPVDVLVADQGSALTSVGVPIAREHRGFLFNPGGTGPGGASYELYNSPGTRCRGAFVVYDWRSARGRAVQGAVTVR